MINLYAHSIYLGGRESPSLPDRISRNIDCFRECYHDFKHTLYNDDSLRNFIFNNFENDVVEAYDKIIPFAYKADLGRYCLLYKLGGVYADLSVIFFRRLWLDDFSGKNLIFFRDGYSHAPWIISNSILLARPGNLLFRNLIDKIVEHARDEYYGFNPLCPTGPNLLGRIAAQTLEMDEFITGEVLKINKNLETWSYAYLLPNGEIYAVNIKNGNGLTSLGAGFSNNYNDYWRTRSVYNKSKSKPTESRASGVNDSKYHSVRDFAGSIFELGGKNSMSSKFKKFFSTKFK